MTEHEHAPDNRDPVESARPSIGRRDEPDALRPDREDRPHRKLPPDPEESAPTGDDVPRPTESRPADGSA